MNQNIESQPETIRRLEQELTNARLDLAVVTQERSERPLTMWQALAGVVARLDSEAFAVIGILALGGIIIVGMLLLTAFT